MQIEGEKCHFVGSGKFDVALMLNLVRLGLLGSAVAKELLWLVHGVFDLEFLKLVRIVSEMLCALYR